MYHRRGLVPRQLYVYDRRRDSAGSAITQGASRRAICNAGVKRDNDMSTCLIDHHRSVFLVSRHAD